MSPKVFYFSKLLGLEIVIGLSTFLSDQEKGVNNLRYFKKDRKPSLKGVNAY